MTEGRWQELKDMLRAYEVFRAAHALNDKKTMKIAKDIIDVIHDRRLKS